MWRRSFGGGDNGNGSGGENPIPTKKVSFDTLFPIKTLGKEIEYKYIDSAPETEHIYQAYIAIVKEFVDLNSKNIQEIFKAGNMDGKLMTMLYSLSKYYKEIECDQYKNILTSTSFTIVFDAEIWTNYAKTQKDKEDVKKVSEKIEDRTSVTFSYTAIIPNKKPSF